MTGRALLTWGIVNGLGFAIGRNGDRWQPAAGVDVMEISRPSDLGDIADLGLTLAEAKQLLARVQQAVVAAQAHDHAVLRPDCSILQR